MRGNFYEFFISSIVFFSWPAPVSLFFTLLLEFVYAFYVGRIRGAKALTAVVCCSLVTWPFAASFYSYATGVFPTEAAVFWFFILTEFLVILAEWRLMLIVIKDSRRMLKLSAGMNAFSALFFPVIAGFQILLGPADGTNYGIVFFALIVLAGGIGFWLLSKNKRGKKNEKTAYSVSRNLSRRPKSPRGRNRAGH